MNKISRRAEPSPSAFALLHDGRGINTDCDVVGGASRLCDSGLATSLATQEAAQRRVLSFTGFATGVRRWDNAFGTGIEIAIG
jgi:hypothetical protein